MEAEEQTSYPQSDNCLVKRNSQINLEKVSVSLL